MNFRTGAVALQTNPLSVALASIWTLVQIPAAPFSSAEEVPGVQFWIMSAVGIAVIWEVNSGRKISSSCFLYLLLLIILLLSLSLSENLLFWKLQLLL